MFYNRFGIRDDILGFTPFKFYRHSYFYVKVNVSLPTFYKTRKSD